MDWTKEETSLVDLFDEIRSGYDLAANKEVVLRWEYDTELPVVNTDGEKLKHIIQNLVGNALKFTEKGSVTVSARFIPDSMRLEFKVSDTGVGIPPEELATIFEMFKQVDSSDTRRHGGLGIGLFIVKKFTEMLGGSIDVKSEPANGSCLTVTLPAEITSWKDSHTGSPSPMGAPPIPSPRALYQQTATVATIARTQQKTGAHGPLTWNKTLRPFRRCRQPAVLERYRPYRLHPPLPGAWRSS